MTDFLDLKLEFLWKKKIIFLKARIQISSMSAVAAGLLATVLCISVLFLQCFPESIQKLLVFHHSPLLRSGKVVLYHLLGKLTNGEGTRNHLEALQVHAFDRSPFATSIPCICGKINISRTHFC